MCSKASFYQTYPSYEKCLNAKCRQARLNLILTILEIKGREIRNDLSLCNTLLQK